MGLPTGFLEIERKDRPYEKVEKRLKSWKEFVLPLPPAEVSKQGARCMDCGIPFCHNGCPVNNLIPDWNELVRRDRWRDALDVLHSTNNFPEFTGRICPAPCEAACTLNIDDNPVTIKVDRVLDRRSRLGGGLDRAAGGGAQDRQARRRRRLRPGRHGLRAAARARRPRGHAVREGRPHRRPAALRHPRFQDGEAPDRPAHAPDGGRGRRVPHRRRSRRDALDQVAARRL